MSSNILVGISAWSGKGERVGRKGGGWLTEIRVSGRVGVRGRRAPNCVEKGGGPFVTGLIKVSSRRKGLRKDQRLQAAEPLGEKH